jgi:hypothetical protein
LTCRPSPSLKHQLLVVLVLVLRVRVRVWMHLEVG